MFLSCSSSYQLLPDPPYFPTYSTPCSFFLFSLEIKQANKQPLQNIDFFKQLQNTIHKLSPKRHKIGNINTQTDDKQDKKIKGKRQKKQH